MARTLHMEERSRAQLRPPELEQRRAKENAMNAPEIMLVMLLVRLVMPFGLMLWIGESVRRHQLANLHQM
jgi:hypothetical protein